jgi:hypothetical protein
MAKKFDNQLADAQATQVLLVTPENFDFAKYEAYADELNQTCVSFWEKPSGGIVYRRMREGECISFGCRDMKRSLELQLGALEKSMMFKADVPNFLEPWYGIGTVASAVGGILFSAAVGLILEFTGSYYVIFGIASVAYLLCWLSLYLLVPDQQKIEINPTV